jgi:mannose-6-phosphate isomerase
MNSLHNPDLYPLKLVALPKEKVWGGSKIAATFRKDLDTNRPIGEIWVIWGDLAIQNGPLRDRKLDDLIREHPRAFLGRRVADRHYPEFPLLVKILDARDTLSVQVHPTDAYAQEREGEPFGKAEVWYVLGAETDARLIHGVERPVSRSEAEQAIDAGRLQDVLQYVEVEAGDVVYNPAGTIHALGSGIFLYELQQSSDLTYRLYDWDRRDPNRPLHVEKALDVADLEPYPVHKIRPVERKEDGATRTMLCASQHFAAELIQIDTSIREQPGGTCFHILTAFAGSGQVRDVAFCCGDSLLIPAGVDEYEIQAEEPLKMIKAWVPDLQAEVVEPLRERGVPDDAIAQLGGIARHSDLVPLLRIP